MRIIRLIPEDYTHEMLKILATSKPQKRWRIHHNVQVLASTIDDPAPIVVGYDHPQPVGLDNSVKVCYTS